MVIADVESISCSIYVDFPCVVPKEISNIMKTEENNW